MTKNITDNNISENNFNQKTFIKIISGSDKNRLLLHLRCLAMTKFFFIIL